MSCSNNACATLPPVVSDYKPRGSTTTVDGMEVYDIGAPSITTTVIVVPDIFGLSAQVKQVCDRIHEGTGFHVVLPDLLRGESWSLSQTPPSDKAAFHTFLNTTCSWESNQQDVHAVIQHLKQQGATTFAALGLCWGASITAHMAAIPDYNMVAVGMVHYSRITPELLDTVSCPVALLPSKDEAPEDDFVAVLKSKPWANVSVVQRFDDMHHGFCAARADFSNPLNAQRATEAITIVIDLIKRCVPQ